MLRGSKYLALKLWSIPSLNMTVFSWTSPRGERLAVRISQINLLREYTSLFEVVEDRWLAFLCKTLWSHLNRTLERDRSRGVSEEWAGLKLLHCAHHIDDNLGSLWCLWPLSTSVPSRGAPPCFTRSSSYPVPLSLVTDLSHTEESADSSYRSGGGRLPKLWDN